MWPPLLLPLLLLLLLPSQLLLLLTAALPAGGECPTDREKLAAGCCLRCPPGHGLLSRCFVNGTAGLQDTVCQKCSAAKGTFSSVDSALSNCEKCKPCGRLERVARECTVASDTVCRCIEGHFRPAGPAAPCRRCSKCRSGTGRVAACGRVRDTRCRDCQPGLEFSAFSQRLHNFVCRRCRLCPAGRQVMRNCTPEADVVCEGDAAQLPAAVASDWKQLIDNGNAAPADLRRFNFSLGDAAGKHNAEVPTAAVSSSNDMIPVYCGILGAVIVSLSAWMLYKFCSRRSRDLKSSPPAPGTAANAASNPLMLPTQLGFEAAAKKRRSGDSGFGDAGGGGGSRLLRDISASRFLRLERILSNSDDADAWRLLAAEIGFQESDADEFAAAAEENKQSPIRLMLRSWSEREDSTVGALSRALLAVGRQDALILFKESASQHHHRKQQQQQQQQQQLSGLREMCQV